MKFRLAITHFSRLNDYISYGIETKKMTKKYQNIVPTKTHSRVGLD